MRVLFIEPARGEVGPRGWMEPRGRRLGGKGYLAPWLATRGGRLRSFGALARRGGKTERPALVYDSDEAAIHSCIVWTAGFGNAHERIPFRAPLHQNGKFRKNIVK